jgi:hypothetical protein
MPSSGSLILLKDSPAPDREIHTVNLGPTSDGIFVRDDFPAAVEFGLLLRLQFGQKEFGAFELSLMLSSVLLTREDTDDFPEDAFDLVSTRTLFVPEPDPSWTTPRQVFVPIGLRLGFYSEADVVLWAVVDDSLVANHPLLVRSALALPMPVASPPAD